ncbi:YdeI/OmpD-associated family protein [Ralstonia pseudosolanacearum]|uniref:OmdA domain containing protein n=1 Tax=Ralstonia solanacearum TaxID=305 RepID=A0AAD0WGY0_RALSL|nr:MULTISPECIES: YdeI/OmpD-associated family protein [Ralstonia solanacearum species complex]AXV82266.1 hypothetical protein CJO77_12410 [Ralstonia solanacearum]AXW53393.1 hypothetical protein CJO92_12410 [Ralstonia solanacearum]MDC6292760.1 YdeI/OmpD-associated family protein [Ralstonia pseudosolanacearum]MDD7787914.1 YdeI/OmpD-associated family protein [Ralstonia pseudosolanacearum]MDN3369858.1 YdeI/OmpD-associated family protein [Ralstonia pseudosolanacearum]
MQEAPIQENKSGLPVLGFVNAWVFEQWLLAQPDAPGVWIKLAKKGSGLASITRQQAVDVALCHGWIDGQGASYDEHYFLLRFTPRRPRSIWSQVNRARVEALIADGHMRPAGLAQIEAAKADGRWDAAYPPQSQALTPNDLQAALATCPEAAAAFDALSRSKRYALLNAIVTVKRAETRARKITELIARLSKREDAGA